jgi:hypothetical protein
MRWMLLVALLPSIAIGAQWDECNFRITDDPENIGAKQPEGYKIYLEKDQSAIRNLDIGNRLDASCSEVFIEGDEGLYSAYATAYNSAGESDPSPSVDVQIDPIPLRPSPPHLKVEFTVTVE